MLPKTKGPPRFRGGPRLWGLFGLVDRHAFRFSPSVRVFFAHRRHHASQARVRPRAERGLLADTGGGVEATVTAGDPVSRAERAQARLAAAHIVRESKDVITLLLNASGASAHFLDNPLQRAKRDVDVLSGHVIFDYDTSRELAGALTIGAKVAPTSMI